ncbi:hypothetical protein PHMEG_00023742 [Phytophthora megakarya]|uniref:RxLR effector protein n=1 Tax=Phytophthora megakarya TaxID=4795 RepID=A0A225VHN2_9STRA|nr:hypothetical protein PHMEG_00023742 [Phytophthora megakarya]
MGLLVWIRLAMLIALITLSTGLSLEANTDNLSEVESATNFEPNIKAGIVKSDIMENTDEERVMTILEGLKTAVAKSAHWSQKNILRAIKVVAGRESSDKVAMVMAYKVWFPIIYKRGITPEKIVEMASKQTDLAKKGEYDAISFTICLMAREKTPQVS